MIKLLLQKRVLVIAMMAMLANFTSAQNFRISGSNTHSVALCDNGTVYAWGENTNGEIGLDPTTGATPATMTAYPATSYNEPKLVGGLGEIFQIDAGSGSHTLAMTCQGRVYAWGRNDTDQLGNPTEATGAFSARPVLVQRGAAPDVNGDGYLGGVSYVSGGNDESYAILEDGRLVAWGQNDKGQLGNGNFIDQPTPVFVRTATGQLQNVIQVEAGDENGYALTEDGRVWSWGSNDSRALGRNTGGAPTDRYNTAAPVQIMGGGELTDIVSITAGDRHALFIDVNGNVWSVGGDWGRGQRGYGPGYDDWDYATLVAGGASGETYLGDDDPIIEVAAGQAHSMAVSASGNLYTWGANAFFRATVEAAGQLGVGINTINNADTPANNTGPWQVPMQALYSDNTPVTNAAGVSDGDAWTFLIADDDRVFVAGYNQRGELGLNNTANQNRFTELDLASQGCGLVVPCPALDLGPDFEVCPGFTYDIEVGDVYPGFTVEYYLDGVLQDDEPIPYVFNGGPTAIPPYTVTEVGTWEVRIFDNRTGTQRSCSPCPDAIDELIISYYDANFDDPGDLTFCGTTGIGNVVESGAATSMTNDYEWYTSQVGGTLLGTSTDEGNVNITMTTPGISFTGTTPNRTATVWVEDVSSFTGTLRSNSSCPSGNGTQGHRNQYQITIATEVDLTSVDLVANGNNENYSNLSIIISDNTGTRWDGSANQPYAGTPIYTSPGVSGTTTAGATITIPTNFTLSPGVYWITTTNSPNLRAGCTTTNNTILDPGGGTAVTSGNNFTDNGSSASNNNNPFYNLEFVGGSPFPCDRLPFEIVEDCPPCNKPTLVTIDNGDPVEICEGTALNLTGTYTDGGNPVANGAMNYTWYKEGATPVYTTGTVVAPRAFPSVTTANDGKWYLRVEDGNTGDPSCYTEDSIIIAVDAQPDLTTTDPSAVCSPTTVDITANPAVWSDNNAANTTGATITYHNATPAAPGNAITNQAAISTSGTYYVLSTNGQCSDEAPIVVTIDETPSFTVTDPAAQCAGTIDLSTALDGGSLSPATATLSYHSDPAATSANVNPVAATGTYYIKATNASNATCTFIESVDVVIDAQPDLTSTDPAAVCAPNTVDITGEWSDNNAANTAGATVTYHSATPAGAGNAITNEAAIATSGTYYVLSTNGTCTDEAPVVVTINPLPAKPTITSNFVFCEDEDTSGDDIEANVAGSGTYTWYDASKNPITKPDFTNVLATSGTPGVTRYGVSQTDGNGCEGDTAMISVTVNPAPTPVIATPTPMCEDDVQTVSVTAPNATSTYAWSVVGTGSSDNGSTSGSIAITAGTGGITVEVTETDANGCSATSAQEVIAVDQLPPAATVGSPTLDVCVVDPISLNGNAAAPGTGIWTKETGSSATATINTPSNPTSGVTMLGGDVLIAKWTITSTNGYCPATDATVTVNATAVANPTANLAVDVATICEGGTVTFTATGNNLGTSPTFAFYEVGNATPLQADGPGNTYTTGALTADLSVEVVITSNSSCVTPGNESVTSAPVTVTVITPATADITGYNDGDTHTTPNTTENYSAANPGTGYSGSWTLTDNNIPVSTAGKTDAGLSTTVNNLEKDKPVDLCWTVEDNGTVCPSATECITIENKDLTSPDPGPDVTICSTDLPFTRAGNGPDTDPVLETYSWSDDDGAGADVTSNANEVTVPAGTAAGIYNFTFTVNNSVAGSSAASFRLVILDPAVADITGFNNGDNYVTNAANATFTATDPGAGYTYKWQFTDALNTTADSSSTGLTMDITALEYDKPVTLSITVTDTANVCASATETITIERKNVTGADVTDQTLCEEDLGTLGAISPNSLPNTALNEEAEWLEDNAASAGTIVSEDPTTHALTLNLTAPGVYTYVYRIYNPTLLDGSGNPVESRATMTVTVNATPSGSISGSASICAGTTATLTYSFTSGASPYTLNTTAPAPESMPGTSVTNGQSFTVSTEGNYVINSITDANNCTLTGTPIVDSVGVSVNPLPGAAGAILGNFSVCPASPLETYSISAVTNATSYNWTISPSVPLTNNGTSVDLDFGGIAVGTYVLTVEPENNCDVGASSSVNIDVIEEASPDIILPNPGTLCFGEPKTFTTIVSGLKGLPGDYQWFLNDVPIGGATNSTYAMPQAFAGELKVRVTTNYSCSVDSTDMDSIIIGVVSRPNPIVSIPDDHFCETIGGGYISQTTFEETGANYTYRWYVDYPGDFVGEQFLQTGKGPILVNKTGTYRLEVKNDVCSASGEAYQQVIVDKKPIVDAGRPEVIDQDEIGYLLGTASNYEIAIWETGDLVVNSPYFPETSFYGDKLRFRQLVKLKAINGECSDSSYTTVTVRPSVLIPNVFTPNGDTENEFFVIENIEYYPDMKLRIFNRWGNEVYRHDEGLYKGNEWDGKRNGVPMPIATYYYILELDEDKDPIQGSVTIIR